MTFAELVAEVINLTKRPDLQTKIEGFVRAATLKAHHSGFYYPDMIETGVQFDDVFILQSFVPTEVVANFRKAKYVRRWVGGLDGNTGSFFEPIQIENSIDRYGITKPEVFYMAGQNLQMRGKTEIDKVLFGCYVHPIITPAASYSSWIANDMPYTIIYEAVRATYMNINNTAQAQYFQQLVAEQYQELQMSYVDDTPVT